MTEPCNPVTQTYRGAVTNPAPHHTTPHHTTKEPGLSSSDSVRSGHVRQTDQIAVTAAALLSLRPDWRWDHTYEALRDDPRPWRTVVAAGFTCALDPQAHPRLIQHTTARRFEAETAPTPIPPPWRDVQAAIRRLDEEPQP